VTLECFEAVIDRTEAVVNPGKAGIDAVEAGLDLGKANGKLLPQQIKIVFGC
jgi:hypothetical protein